MAGPVHAQLDGIDLRAIRLQGHAMPMIDRVYVAVRDRDWDTIPATISDLVVEPSESSFLVSFRARHRAGDIDFAWDGRIEGDDGGELRYTMTGTARAAFDYCRIGFCILHPDELAGSEYRARTADGSIADRLPRLVEPQLIVDGFEQALCPPFDQLVVRTPEGMSVETTFSGDLFETEDQRNWTDASFKTYCTPIALGYPHRAEAGQAFGQSVTIRLSSGEGRQARAAASGPSVAASGALRLDIGQGTGQGLPAVGLALASDDPTLTEREASLLRALRLDHLRVDVRPGLRGWQERLDEAARQASRLGCGLEVALFVPSGGSDGRPGKTAARRLMERIGEAPIARLLVFDEASAGTGTTPAGLASDIRAGLDERHRGVTIAGGTDGDFAELNRAYPALDGLDALVYSINPKVHAADDRTILENATAQGVTVTTARARAGDRGIAVSPVTLAPRFNPAAVGPESQRSPDELPRAVDHRQLSQLGAAWTVASIAGLAYAGAASVTWYETVGWRGLIERESGGGHPRFPSAPGMAFPAYHAFADLAEMREGELAHIISSAPRSLAGLVLRQGDRMHGLAANLTPDALAVDIGPVGGQVRYRILDEASVVMATEDPEAFRRTGSAIETGDRRLRITLAPYAVIVFGCSA